MSRYTEYTGRFEIAYGYDRQGCGWFVQVFDLHSIDPDLPIVDDDQRSQGLTYEQLLAAAAEYGAQHVAQRFRLEAVADVARDRAGKN